MWLIMRLIVRLAMHLSAARLTSTARLS